ncbi:MAG: argininosuccinate lyase [Bacteroidetes bacterium]|jgi:argininosuccinate lyase|nr:argininosuccinate lyase [Bacteroidota bacterium]
MKLWDKGVDVNKEIEKFTVGKDRELDLLLAEYDVLGSIAHGIMLESIKLLSKAELKQIIAELKNIYSQIKQGRFIIEEGVEDVHSQVELLLTNTLGDTGKKIHSGRSRNDQVLLDLKLFTRHQLLNMVARAEELFSVLQKQSEQHKNVLMPGYTHLQVAMPSSFGLWFGAYAESLTDDLQLALSAYKITNQNPLGSAAGYGSSFPLNRTMTTELLGFDNLNYNVVYAQMGRGKMEKTVAFALASMAATVGKLAADACMYMSQNFNFISLPDELTTGSSIMPHKKNPDVFELIRAKCNKIQNLPNEIGYLTANLTSGYFRDMQVLKESFLPVFVELESCFKIMTHAVKEMEVNKDILNDPKYDYLFSVEEVNNEVLNGVAFRDAYKKVGENIQKGHFKTEKEINHTHEGSIGNLCNKEIAEKMANIVASFNIQKVEKSIEKLLLY